MFPLYRAVNRAAVAEDPFSIQDVITLCLEMHQLTADMRPSASMIASGCLVIAAAVLTLISLVQIVHIIRLSNLSVHSPDHMPPAALSGTSPQNAD
jgi:hypothetical protein